MKFKSPPKTPQDPFVSDHSSSFSFNKKKKIVIIILIFFVFFIIAALLFSFFGRGVFNKAVSTFLSCEDVFFTRYECPKFRCKRCHFIRWEYPPECKRFLGNNNPKCQRLFEPTLTIDPFLEICVDKNEPEPYVSGDEYPKVLYYCDK